MRALSSRVRGIVSWLLLGLGGWALIFQREEAPIWVILGLLTAIGPLGKAWRMASGTALRPLVVWGGIAVLLAAIGQAVAWGEPLESGRPGAGHWSYLSSLAVLAALISVFNARRPGGGAWALLMGLLVLVFLLPWLEGSGLAGGVGGLDRLWLEAPWSWFFALLALAGTTNYLPTRYGPAAAVLLGALAAEFAGLVGLGLGPEVRGRLWSASAWGLAVAVQVAATDSQRKTLPATSGLERLWMPFRDHWGLIWGLRIMERFNRSAQILGWPIRLSWQGVVPAEGVEGPAEPPPPAEATLRGLLRRFADPARMEHWARLAGTPGDQMGGIERRSSL
ncbi:hypothetical protein BH23PLA1_BH23PLA1_18100 [soil metagenome]